jgi:hypothetical protein
MNWTIGGLLSSVANAWSGEHWLYTLAFWILVGLATWALSRSSKDRDEQDGA